ncbi:MAG: hypothetical protein ACP5O2_09605 [Bacteroidales bacterium]
MPVQNRQSVFDALRLEYPWFSYESYYYTLTEEKLEFGFHFNLSDRYSFRPKMSLPIRPWFVSLVANHSQQLETLVFHIGMIELISYWKAACSPRVIIKPATLTTAQIDWWKKLYFNGLGEFFYINGIQTTQDAFMEIEPASESRVFEPEDWRPEQHAYLVPIGGGKDSAVTLELLKEEGYRTVPLIMNPRQATVDTLTVAGFSESESVIIHRSIDPVLLQLNEQGFLNGHTPFSALLAFYTLLAARLTGIGQIALSNERSANESTVSESPVNHQYSKSFEFEKDFTEYVNRYIGLGYRYFSFLRPLHEVQIARIFSRLEAYHPVFRSCNVGSKTDSWCGSCPKCLFAWIILEPFTGEQKLERIFNKNLLQDGALLPYLDELTGQTSAKPFECVGTISEVNASLEALLARHERPLPILLEHAAEYLSPGTLNLEMLLHDFNDEHFLTPTETSILIKALEK